MQPIYLDFNATTPLAPEALEAMLPYLAEHFGNPSSSYALGRACREAMEDARAKVAALLGAWLLRARTALVQQGRNPRECVHKGRIGALPA